MPYNFYITFNGKNYYFYFIGINKNTNAENLNVPSVKVRANDGWAEWHVGCSDPTLNKNNMSQAQYAYGIQQAFSTGFNAQNFYGANPQYNPNNYNHYVTDVIPYSRLCKKTQGNTNSISSSTPESLDTI